MAYLESAYLNRRLLIFMIPIFGMMYRYGYRWSIILQRYVWRMMEKMPFFFNKMLKHILHALKSLMSGLNNKLTLLHRSIAYWLLRMMHSLISHVPMDYR